MFSMFKPHPVTWGQFDPSHFQKRLYTQLFITRFCDFKTAFGGLAKKLEIKHLFVRVLILQKY